MNVFTEVTRVVAIILMSFLLFACGSSSSGGGREEDDAVDAVAPLVGSRIPARELLQGDTAVIEIVARNLPLVDGGGFDLTFDPTVLQVDRVELDPAWEFANQVGTIDNVTGEVSGILFNSMTGNGDEVRIATIEATMIGTGSSAIRLRGVELFPFASDGEVVTMQFETNSVVVN